MSEVGKGVRSGKTLWSCSRFRIAQVIEIDRQGSKMGRFVFIHLSTAVMSTYQPRRWKGLSGKYELRVKGGFGLLRRPGWRGRKLVFRKFP